MQEDAFKETNDFEIAAMEADASRTLLRQKFFAEFGEEGAVESNVASNSSIPRSDELVVKEEQMEHGALDRPIEPAAEPSTAIVGQQSTTKKRRECSPWMSQYLYAKSHKKLSTN